MAIAIAPPDAPAVEPLAVPRLPTWAELLWSVRSPYKIVAGGRGSAKSWSVAIVLLAMSLERKLRIVCLREVQNTMEDSVKKLLEDRAEEYFPGMFTIMREQIISATGSVFKFTGMNGATARNIMSRESVDIFWFEQGETLSDDSAEKLHPTIRKAGSELWITFNPRFRQDTVWRQFMSDSARRRSALVIEAHYMHNPFWNAKMEAARLVCLLDEPERYDHIYMGKPDDEGDTRKVIPYRIARLCVEAWDKLTPAVSGVPHVGLDISDTGADKNAMVTRTGPLLWDFQQWRAEIPADTAMRADQWCRSKHAGRLYYDVTGIGSAVRSKLTEMAREHGKRPYLARPVPFGGPVEGPDEEFVFEITNKDYFEYRRDQMGWGLQMRARRTERLMNGESVNPRDCLFIDKSRIPLWETLINQLAQPEWQETSSGHIKIEKQPK